MGCWAVNGEHLAETLVVIALHQRELNRRVVELFDVVTTGLGGDDLLNLDDLQGKNWKSKKSAKLRVKLRNFTWIE